MFVHSCSAFLWPVPPFACFNWVYMYLFPVSLRVLISFLLPRMIDHPWERGGGAAKHANLYVLLAIPPWGEVPGTKVFSISSIGIQVCGDVLGTLSNTPSSFYQPLFSNRLRHASFFFFFFFCVLEIVHVYKVASCVQSGVMWRCFDKAYAVYAPELNPWICSNPNSLDNNGSCWILKDFYCSVAMLRELGLLGWLVTLFLYCL